MPRSSSGLPLIRFLIVVSGILPVGMPTAGADESPAGAASVADREADVAFFESRIRPLLAQHCYECHSTEKGPENGGLILDTVQGIAAGGDRGPILDPTNPQDGLLWQAVSYSDPDLEMPPAGKLPDLELSRLKEWLDRGAVLPEFRPQTDHRPAAIDYEAGRQFWSFRPLSDVPVPGGADVSRPGAAIDAFVDHALSARQLARNPEAERRTLLRRMSFDVIGLPPTPDEVAAFLADATPDPIGSLVDRLLGSPHFGERQARLWLDLARYADFTPDWQSPTDRGWIYRDWVVDAFNRNRPYDQFVRLQLAADLIPDCPPEDQAALGFLGLSPTYWKELRLAPAVIEQIVADEWDERMDAVSRTFLGLTVSCARCHDHKFDPISTEDYYGLAGVFASTQLHERPLLPVTEAQRVMEARSQARELEARLKQLQEQKSPEADAVAAQLDALRKETPHFDAPFAHVLREASIFVLPEGDELTKLEYREGVARDLPVFRRGNPANPGEVVPRRFLTVLRHDASARFDQGSGRLQLAEAICHDAAGLTARVIVNRIWDEHFGAGLVRTPSDFGSQGERPSHPELLEYLANELVKRGWDLKWLHREILLSGTYRQSSAWRADGAAVDPDNRLLWRANRRRLDFEQWRDAALAVAGRLDLTPGGPSKPIDDATNLRRTLYTTIDREELHPILRMHDFPEASSHSPRREPTTTPLQQLFVLNSPWMTAQADALSERLLASVGSHAAPELPGDSATTAEQPALDAPDVDQLVSEAYLLLFARPPEPEERDAAIRFLQGDPDPASAGAAGSTSAELLRSHLKDYVQALLGLNEFHFVD